MIEKKCILKKEFPNIVKMLVDSIYSMPKLHHLDWHDLPSRDEVIDILKGLKLLCFPGYHRHNLCSSNLEYYVGETVETIWVKMRSEFTKDLYHESEIENKKPIDFQEQAEDIIDRFFKKLPEIRAIIETDVQATYDGDPAAKNLHEIIISYPGLDAISTYRLAHQIHILGIPLIPRIMTEYAHSITGIDIHPGAEIGESFFIDHGTGVVIGETTEIGKNVKIYQGVTLGALSFPKDEQGKLIRGKKRHPTVKDNVTIYANATILGGDTVIGENCVIGGNVWLTESVSPNTKVVIVAPGQKYYTKVSE